MQRRNVNPLKCSDWGALAKTPQSLSFNIETAVTVSTVCRSCQLTTDAYVIDDVSRST